MNNLKTYDPFTGTLTGEFPMDDLATVEQKVSQLNSDQKKWASLSLEKRLQAVQQALQYFEKNRDQIALDICEQMGRPLHHAKGEINGFFERSNYLCSIARSTLAPDLLNDKPGFDRAIEHVPLGVIFVISAWNFPLLITVNSVIPALIAGNTVLLKHSSLTPQIGAHFEKAFGKLFALQTLNQTIVDHKTTGQIIETLPIHHVIFTGSVSGGKSILQHTAKKFMTPTLELGGKDAAYIHEDANLDAAVNSVVDGALFNAGQSCCGIERVYVHEKIYNSFIEKAKKLIETYTLGDPKDSKTTLGPLAQSKTANFIKDQVDHAISNGAKILCGGKIQKIKEGTFFEPTLIVNVNQSMPVMQEENFGPVLPVLKVKDINEAISYTNDSAYGLTSAIFTQNIETAKLFANQVNVGTVFMNRCDYLDPALSWTGVKDSGCGSSLSKYGFYSVTRNKSYHFKILK